MARDPNQLKYPESWKTDAEDLKKLPKPPGIPDADLYGGTYYANVKIYQNGRRVVEWYKRNTGTPGASTPDDPIQATAEDVMPTVREEWDKDEDKPPPTRVINGVPHQVTGKDEQGRDIWAPVQTTTGTATSTASATRPPIPPGGSSETQGTPIKDVNGTITGWDNNRPRQVIKDKDGNVVWSEELTGADLTAWRNAQQANQPQTGETRRPVDGRPGWTQITRSTVQGGNKTESTVYVGPDGKEASTLPAVPGAPTLKPDGKGGTVAVQTMPDGSIRTTPLPGVPSEATSKYKEVRQDDQTGAWWGLTSAGQWERMQGGPGSNQGQTSAGPAAPRVDVGSIQKNLTEYHTELMRRMSLPDGDPEKLSAPQYKRLWDAAVQQAQSSIAEAQTQTTAGNTILDAQTADNTLRGNLANTRLGASNTQFQQAANLVESQNRYLQPGSRAGGRAMAAALGLQQLTARGAGGYENPAPLQVPEGVSRAAGPTRTGFAALDAPMSSLPSPAANGNERPDDVLTIQDTVSGQTVTLTRSEYEEQLQTYPWARQTTRVTNAGPATTVATVPPAPATPTPSVPTPSPAIDPASIGAPEPPLPEDTQRILNNVRPMPGGTPLPPVQMAPSADQFAALAPPQAEPMAAPQMPVAMLATEARMKVPWKMTPDEVERYLAAGVDPADLLAIPGVV